MDIKVALKNALGAIQTPTTASNYQATDLVPLFDSNDQLIGKISRNELMSAVKTSLGTLLNQGAADLGTSLAKIPALNSGGTLGSATVANLASVLGGEYKQLLSGQDINDLTEGMFFSFSTSVIQSLLHSPETTGQEIIIESHPRIKNNPYGYQLYYWIHTGKIWIRHYHSSQGWSSWVEIATDLPSFYKNYRTVDSLKAGIGALTGKVEITTAPIDATMQDSFIQKYVEATDYSLFMAVTTRNYEGGLYGFKHNNKGIGIFMSAGKDLTIPCFIVKFNGTTIDDTTMSFYYM